MHAEQKTVSLTPQTAEPWLRRHGQRLLDALAVLDGYLAAGLMEQRSIVAVGGIGETPASAAARTADRLARQSEESREVAQELHHFLFSRDATATPEPEPSGSRSAKCRESDDHHGPFIPWGTAFLCEGCLTA